MALWTVAEFMTHAGQLTLGEAHVAQADDLARVRTALECWHEPKPQDQRVLEAGLYTVIKECGRWIKTTNNTSDSTRKAAVESLLAQALAELPSTTGAALQHLQGMKSAPNIAQPAAMRSLAPGYSFERTSYTQKGKKGRVLSATDLSEHFHGDEFTKLTEEKVLAKIGIDKPCSVMFLNKIARLQYLVMAVRASGLLVDINYAPVQMKKKMTGGVYVPQMYAMDRHGALFVRPEDDPADYVIYGDRGPEIETKGTRGKIYMNHSSFLAGREVICAGYLHIGLKFEGGWKEEGGGGHLSAISNNSGHYKPTNDDLRRCLLTLQLQGINVNDTRVGFMNSSYQVVFSRGEKFLLNDAPDWDPVNVQKKPDWAPLITKK